jgi:flagellar hook protein FlgE
MTKSFFNGITGLKSFQSGIDIWGNNISNINTIAYKQTQPEFASLFAETIKTSPITSDIGIGSKLDANSINLSQGNIINSDNPFDIALGGKGWLAVKAGDNIYYTRNGSFKRDLNGYLVNDNGNYLLVANANNIIKKENGYEINQNISTKNLINNPLSPIFLPSELTLPPTPTTKVDFFTNLNDNDKINYTTNAKEENDISALYSENGEDLKVRNSQSFVFGFGNPIEYSNNQISSEICINDDKVDGKELVFDFIINDKQINLTLPDGSKKSQIQQALVDKLKENEIDAAISKNGIKIFDKNKIILQSNNNNIPNIAAKKLIYNSNVTNENEFNTLKSLIDKLQTLANIENTELKVSLNNGKIEISNPTENTIHSYLLETENSNKLFIQNLQKVANDIYPNTSNTSYTFKVNQQNFGGNIFDKDGNKDLLTFSFTKQKVLDNQTQWIGNIIVKTADGKIINNTLKTFIFDNKGNLISPKQIVINSPQQIQIDLSRLTAYKKVNFLNNCYFSQNGTQKGELKEYNISEEGIIYAFFSNSKNIALGQIPIFHFQNPQGLESVGENLFKETSNSNKAFLYKDINGTYLPYAKVLSHKLETSNVNFAEAMTELIINQKAFSAAAKTVTTSDEMIQKAINLKRG